MSTKFRFRSLRGADSAAVSHEPRKAAVEERTTRMKISHLYFYFAIFSSFVAKSTIAPPLHKIPGTSILGEFQVGGMSVFLGDR